MERLMPKEYESPICPICKFRVIKITTYNGQNMCYDCKKQLSRGLKTRSFER